MVISLIFLQLVLSAQTKNNLNLQNFVYKNHPKQKFKYDFFDSQALNKMEKCPLCCEPQQSTAALQVHIKKIHPQRRLSLQIAR